MMEVKKGNSINRRAKNSILKLLLFVMFFGTQAFMLWSAHFPAIRKNSGEIRLVHVQPMFLGKKVVLEEPLRNRGGDALTLHTLRFYLSNFVFVQSDSVVFEEKNSWHLLDLEDGNSLTLQFQVPENTVFDELKFDLGIDSLTHVSGAMGGDLDPTKGMFWTWQSGYVNVKLEGTFEKCPTRNHEFQFHLGGYLAPFQSVQAVRLNLPRDLSTFHPESLRETNLGIQLDLTPFFEQVDWAKKYSIMSPCKEAVAASKILANSFSVHAE